MAQKIVLVNGGALIFHTTDGGMKVDNYLRKQLGGLKQQENTQTEKEVFHSYAFQMCICC